MIKIFCVNTQTTEEFIEGTALIDMLPKFNIEGDSPILSAKVNNVSQGLKYCAYKNRTVEFLDYHSYLGRSVYSNSLCFLLYKSLKDLFPKCKLTIHRPISKGYYCTVNKGDGTVLTQEELNQVRVHMTELVEADQPFHRHEVRMEEAIGLFEKLGYDDKIKLIKTVNDLYVKYYTLGDTTDYYYDALVPSTRYLTVWSLTMYRDGLLLRVPDRHNPEQLAPFFEQPKTFEIFSESVKWSKIMGLDNVGDVNMQCAKGEAADLIKVAEALQEKKIVQIAEEIERRVERDEPVKIVLITGPSSSGKSTFCKRLSIQLKACGIQPISFSTDDYFVNRLDTPKLPDGSYDFDNFETVDHEYLQNDIIKLMKGETVEVPEYNFTTGIREMNGKKLRLEKGMVLLVEGIHALNPRLTNRLPDSSKYKIFINTITSISLDDHNCIPTSDNRLLRRIMRDYNKGAFTAQESISNWPNVRRAEVKWIYSFQENADVMFNSTYMLEFSVLRNHAEQILMTVPKNCPEYSDASRLQKFLNYFTPVSDKDIPSTSLIRSFIGGSNL